MDLETVKEWWEFLLPLLPYIGTVAVTHQLMARGIKPMIARNRDPKTKKFYNKRWMAIRQWMWMYPTIIGGLIGAGFHFSTGTGTGVRDIFYHALCGTCAQMLVHLVQDFAKARGYELEMPRDSLTPAAVTSDPPPEA